MIDRKKFNENFQYFDKEIVVEIIDIFDSEFNDRFAAIQKSIDDKDFVQLKFNAHSLKGVIANFMDPAAIELSRKLDEVAKMKETHGLQELYNELFSSSKNLREELKEIKKEFTS